MEVREIYDGKVRLGFIAPKEVQIFRTELLGEDPYDNSREASRADRD